MRNTTSARHVLRVARTIRARRSGNDTVSGRSGAELIDCDGATIAAANRATGVHEVINGGNGNDRLFGGIGNDRNTEGKGKDVIDCGSCTSVASRAWTTRGKNRRRGH